MICDKCQNRQICKYYAFIADAPMTFSIDSCDKYIGKNNMHKNENNNTTQTLFRQPIEYPEDYKEDEPEEKVFVDLSEKHVNKVTSITDLLLGGRDDEQKED